MKRLTGEQIAQILKAYGHLVDHNEDKRTAPFDPLTYRAADDDGVIHFAAFAGDARTVEWLLDAGENINATGDMGLTPAHYAAMNLHQDAFDLLMGRGADPTIRSEFGETPPMTLARALETKGGA